MKYTWVFTLLFIGFLGFSQEDTINSQPIASGTLVLINDDIVRFTDLYYEEDLVRYFNEDTQTNEHLYLPSIRSIEEDATGKKTILNDGKKTASSTNTTKQNPKEKKPLLTDGLYETLGDLKKGNVVSQNVEVKQKNKNRYNYFYLIDDSGRKIRKYFAYAKDGFLYVNGKKLKSYLSTNRGLNFNRNGNVYVGLEEEGGLFIGEGNFSNSGLAIGGAIVSGVVGGILAPGIGSAILIAAGGSALFSLISSTKKEIVIDVKNEKVALMKL